MLLTAYYDLACSPPTYDFVSALVGFEMERIDRGCEAIDLHILPGPAGGFRRDHLPPFAIEDRRRMRDEIVAPMARLLPSVCSVTLHSERPVMPQGDHTVGFDERRYGFGLKFKAAKRGLYPLRPVNPVRASGHDVTITLRETPYWPTRNSAIEEWIKIARGIRSDGHRVAIVRDAETASEPLADFEIAPLASLNLNERIELYAGARLNLFVNNGPAWLCLFAGLPTLIVKMTSPAAPCVDDGFFASVGFRRGDEWPSARRSQCVAWIGDRAEDVLPMARKMLAADLENAA